MIGLPNKSRSARGGSRRGSSLAKIWSVSDDTRSESSTLIKPYFFFAGRRITPNLRVRQSPGQGSLNNNNSSKRQPDVNDVIQAAAELQAICQSQNWRFCFIGGLALQRWSEPRETVDVDLSLFAGFGDEQRFSDVLLNHFAPRISEAAAFARERRVLLLRSTKGVGLDVTLAALPYEALVIERSSYFVYPPDVSLRTCSAEDLIVLKAFAGRGQDWVARSTRSPSN